MEQKKENTISPGNMKEKQPSSANTPFQPWAMSAEQVLRQLQTDSTHGLTTQEVERRIQQYGLNEIPETPPEPLWKRYIGQLTGDAVVILLLVAAAISFGMSLLARLHIFEVEDSMLEAIAIFVMLNIMAWFGLWQEGKASDAARSLRKLDNPLKIVIRDGKRIEISMDQIVPGDIVYLPTGAVAPADGRVIAQVNAEKDTSKLTGESLSVSITLDPLPSTTVVNEQHNMIHRGDAVVAGNVTYVVTETGARTEIGKIAMELAGEDQVETPLDAQLDQLGSAMAKIFIVIAIVVIVPGTIREFFFSKSDAEVSFLSVLVQAFINAVALIIAAIPEGLPAVLVITLAIATAQMVKRNALIRKPKAVEGGGSMTVLLTDKTGTLTANQMEVTHVYLNEQIIESHLIDKVLDQSPYDESFKRLARIAHLCNNSSSSTEQALQRWVELAEFESFGDVDHHRAVEHEFDQTLKRMSTIYPKTKDGDYYVLTKGAPEQIITLCKFVHVNGQDVPIQAKHITAIQEAITLLASQGLRVLALADRIVAQGHALPRHEAECDLTFVGLFGIMDPPREDVAPAVSKLERAGIRTVMITGDNPLTAYYVAKKVGIIRGDMPIAQAVIKGEELTQLEDPSPEFLERLHSVRVFARVTPDHKAQIVQALRDAGFIVGMTGDGVNDAIALKRSDVGFAMGNGTDVAREASDVVLMDSRFGTIPIAVEEGRNVIHRIRLYLSYILSGNGCEVGAFIVAYIIGLPIPFTALVLLVINFATDSFPALAMAFEPGEKDVMEKPPRRRDDPFINPVMWIHMASQTIAATIIIMITYYYCLNVIGTSLEVARAAAFMTYIFQKLYRAFTARSMIHNIWEIGLFQNRWTIGAVALSLTIALISVYVPVINDAMSMDALNGEILLIAATIGFIPPIVEEVVKLFLKRSPKFTKAM